MDRMPEGSVNLVLTSPPFALTSQKEYGNKREGAYIDWFLSVSDRVKKVMATDGSFVVDIGGTYLPNRPVRSIYQYKLLCRLIEEQGFHLAQEFFHYNPARLPAPATWVNVHRIRVKDNVNLVWWLSKTEYPKADNRNVLRPYSNAMKSLLKNGCNAQRRPSGHDITMHFNKDNGGAIPHNVLQLSNTASNDDYMRRCRLNGIKPHPARFPEKFAEFFIRFLTTEGDLILDPFAGSNTTGYIAEQLNRRWVAHECEEKYLAGSFLRFGDASNAQAPWALRYEA